MQRLVFNEITKELDLIEEEQTETVELKIVTELYEEIEDKIQPEEKESTKCKNIPTKKRLFSHTKFIKTREWLKGNKIFFEIFSLVFLGVMGFIISFVGLKVNKRTADIYQKQLEILENDREPYFVMSSEIIFKSVNTNSYYIQNKNTIKNEGGLISEAFIKNIDAYVIISIPIYSKNNYKNFYFKYKIEDKFSIPNSNYIYDEETKEFVFYEVMNSDYEDFTIALERELNKTLGIDDIYISIQNYIEIYYINYKNEEYSKKYKFNSNTIAVKENDNEIFIPIKQKDDVALIAQEILKYIEEWRSV